MALIKKQLQLLHEQRSHEHKADYMVQVQSTVRTKRTDKMNHELIKKILSFR